MNHQTAKIIAESYRAEARAIFDGDDNNPMRGVGDAGWRERAIALHDHAAVWERVAMGLTPPTFKEAPHVP